VCQVVSSASLLLVQVKEEGWWLVLSDAADTELLALKRLSFTGERTVTKLAFPCWDAGSGSPHAQLQLRLLSDSYLGLDQSFSVVVGNSEAAAKALAA
jgi:Sec63 Brl domain